MTAWKPAKGGPTGVRGAVQAAQLFLASKAGNVRALLLLCAAGLASE